MAALTAICWLWRYIPALSVYESEAAIFRTMGNSKITMYLSAMMNFINICGNAVFIYVLKLGTAGALRFGALGVWLAMVCGWLFRAVVFSIRWLRGKWKTYRVV